jgi:RNA polymerase sigma-70 factor (ECF subfamily)
VSSDSVEARAAFHRLLGEMRPKLHRYCARMTGSVVDGEDVVQEAIVKAIEALYKAGSIVHPEGWVFRIAHNATLDFLRRRARQDATRSNEDPAPQVPQTIVRSPPLACTPSCGCRSRSAAA